MFCLKTSLSRDHLAGDLAFQAQNGNTDFSSFSVGIVEVTLVQSASTQRSDSVTCMHDENNLEQNH